MIGFPIDSRVTYDESGTPSYDRAITSAPYRSLLKQLFKTGIMPTSSTNMQVSAGTGLQVSVAAGFAMVEGCMKLETTAQTLTLEEASTDYARIDTIVLRLDDNEAVRSCEYAVVTGTPASSPVHPDLTRTSSIYEIGLADVKVAKNATKISASNITDTRYDTDRCGVVSSISEFDTETIYTQVQADLSEFKSDEETGFATWSTEQKAEFNTWSNEQKTDFAAWVQTIKDILDSETAGHLQLEIDANTANISPIYEKNYASLNEISDKTSASFSEVVPINGTLSVDGLTITGNGEGVYTVNGTSTKKGYVTLGEIDCDGSYYYMSGGYSYALYLEAVKAEGGSILATDQGDGATFTTSEKVVILLCYIGDATLAERVLSPMVCKGHSEDFQPRMSNNLLLSKRIYNICDDIASTLIESGSQNYSVGDCVIYNDILYKCISDCTGSYIPTKFPSYWEKITVTDKLSDIDDKANKDIVSDAFINSASQTYSEGDYAIYEDTLYKCTGDCTGGTLPTESGANWEAVNIADMVANLESNLDGTIANSAVYGTFNGLLTSSTTVTDIFNFTRTYRGLIYLNSTDTTTRGYLVNLGLIPKNETGFGILGSSSGNTAFMMWLAIDAVGSEPYISLALFKYSVTALYKLEMTLQS